MTFWIGAVETGRTSPTKQRKNWPCGLRPSVGKGHVTPRGGSVFRKRDHWCVAGFSSAPTVALQLLSSGGGSCRCGFGPRVYHVERHVPRAAQRGGRARLLRGLRELLRRRPAEGARLLGQRGSRHRSVPRTPASVQRFCLCHVRIPGGRDGCRPYSFDRSCGVPCSPATFFAAEKARTCVRKCQNIYYQRKYEEDKHYGSFFVSFSTTCLLEDKKS